MRSRATLDLQAGVDAYRVAILLEVSEGDEVVGRRDWLETIPRDLA